MIDFLYKNFGKAPVVGQPITIAYISAKVKDLVSGKSATLDPEAKKLSGKELEGQINKQATALYDEHIQPSVNETGLPSEVSNEVKKKAIKEISAKLKDQAMSKVA
jgi:hypothetical protein